MPDTPTGTGLPAAPPSADDWAEALALSVPARRQWRSISGLPPTRRSAAQWRRDTALVGALLAACGVLMALAGQWSALPRALQFGLLQGLVLLLCSLAAAVPAARAAAGSAALLATGGLLTFFGLTYQSGADPWQLFALWAALTLPLALAVRHDAAWVPWALVTLTAIGLWAGSHLGWRFRHADGSGAFWHLAAWGLSLLLCLGLSAPLQRFTGAGLWSLRGAATCSVMIITSSALEGLFGWWHSAFGPLYGMGLLTLLALGALFSTPRAFDLFILSGVALALNALLDAGLGRVLVEVEHHGDPIGSLLLWCLAAAGLLAATVKGLMTLNRRSPAAAETAE